MDLECPTTITDFDQALQQVIAENTRRSREQSAILSEGPVSSRTALNTASLTPGLMYQCVLKIVAAKPLLRP